MRVILSFIKRLSIGLIISIISILSISYLALNVPLIQLSIKDISATTLSSFFNTSVTIGDAKIQPFNKFTFRDVLILDQQNDTLLYTEKLSANFRWSPLLSGRVSFSTIQLMGFDARMYKSSKDKSSNFKFLVDKFKRQDSVKTKMPFDLVLRNIFLSRGKISYDDLDRNYRLDFDKNHLQFYDIKAAIALHSYNADSLNLELDHLSFSEKSGINLKGLSLKIEADRQKAYLKDLSLELPKSKIDFDSLTVDYRSVNDSMSFVDSAYFKIYNFNAVVTPQDLTAFAPKLTSFSNSLKLEIDADGYINQMRLHKLYLYANNKIDIRLNGSLDNISTIDKALMKVNIQNADLTPDGTNFLLENLGVEKFADKPWTKNIGDINFNGYMSGLISDIYAKGYLSSDVGELFMDLSLKSDKAQKELSVEGRVTSNNLELSKLTNNPDGLDNLSFELDVEGKTKNSRLESSTIFGNISSFDFKKYTYENLSINTKSTGTFFEGGIYLHDPNGKVEINGAANFDGDDSFFNFSSSLQDVNLNALNLTHKYDSAVVSVKLRADFTGNRFDNATGLISIDSITFASADGSFLIPEINLAALNNQDPQEIIVGSNIINGNISGEFLFKYLTQELHYAVGASLPILAREDKKKLVNNGYNNFDFKFEIDSTQQITKLLKLPVTLEEKSTIEGYINSKAENFKLAVSAPNFMLGKVRLEAGSFLITKPNEDVRLRLYARRLNKANVPTAITLQALSKDGQLLSNLDWSNISNPTFSGKIVTTTTFERDSLSNINTHTRFDKSNIIIKDSIWNISPSVISYNNKALEVDSFKLSHDDRYLLMNGRLSNDNPDTLALKLKEMDLDYIFDLVNKDFIKFGGVGTGEFQIALENNLPKIKTDSLIVEDFTYNQALLGRLKVLSKWDASNMGILMDGQLSYPGYAPTLINGGIYLGQDSLNLNFKANHTNIEFIRLWTDKIIRDVKGYAYGDLTLYGKFKEINLVGEAYGEDVSMGIDYLNTRYSFSDSIKFDLDGIKIKNLTLYDSNGSEAIVNGGLYHKCFKDLKYDIRINIPDGEPFQAFNLTERINPLFWGSIYASGSARIYGTAERTDIDVTARSSAKSKFYFSINSEATASDYKFIEFNNIDYVAPTDNTTVKKAIVVPAPQNEHELRVNLQMEATPDVEINLIMDPATGDVISGVGSGNIRVEYDPKNDFKMYGGYTIEKGSYYFNLQDVIMRDFRINEGSTVNFQGDPLNARLGIEAIYQVTANLTDLDDSFANSKELSRPNVPVECILHIDGDMLRPDLSFDINLPTVSSDIDRQVKSIIGTEDMMNKQILYLLVLNKFMTPDFTNSGTQNRFNDLSSVASSTLSSQLNNLLGQISDNWNIGTNIRSDKGDFSDLEVELALSSQLLNNRLLLNGNFGYRDNNQANTSFIGDFDLAYILNRSRTLRLKAYNHYNDRNYSIKSALTTQGVGLIFKKDFSNIRQLFMRYVDRKRIRKEEKEKKKE